MVVPALCLLLDTALRQSNTTFKQLSYARSARRIPFGLTRHVSTDIPSQTTTEKPLTPTTKATGTKQVVSYSLYGGKNSRYTDGAIANADLMPEVYPGWEMRIYHDNTIPKEIYDNLHGRPYVRLMNMTDSVIENQMVWRFLVASDHTVERFVSRDIDSRLSFREKAAVDEWIASGKKFHVMRDHPSHTDYAMSGGMWGATSTAIPDMEARLTARALNPKYFQDMSFLADEVWPLAENEVLQHDAFGCHGNKWGETKPFPTKRVEGEHIGSVWLKGKMRAGDVNILTKQLKNECV